MARASRPTGRSGGCWRGAGRERSGRFRSPGTSTPSSSARGRPGRWRRACWRAPASRVLLVERKAFPRPKVCGGCLNAQALAALDRAGLGDSVRALGARPIWRRDAAPRVARRDDSAAARPCRLARGARRRVGRRRGATPAPCSRRRPLALVMDEGETPAHEGWRQVALQPRHGQPSTARARVILAADGLSHSSLRECASLRSLPAPRAPASAWAASCRPAPSRPSPAPSRWPSAGTATSAPSRSKAGASTSRPRSIPTS